MQSYTFSIILLTPLNKSGVMTIVQGMTVLTIKLPQRQEIN